MHVPIANKDLNLADSRARIWPVKFIKVPSPYPHVASAAVRFRAVQDFS